MIYIKSMNAEWIKTLQPLELRAQHSGCISMHGNLNFHST